MSLTCPECHRSGFTRLTRHFSQIHGLSRDEVVARYPGLMLEEVVQREVRCVSCHDIVEGYSGRAANVKCDRCRATAIKHKKVKGDSDSIVACRICGVARKRLDLHVQAEHGIDVKAYAARFPDAPTFVRGQKRTAETRAKQAAAAKRRWASPAERAAQSERLKESAPWKGKRLSEEHKAAISKGGTGVKHVLSDEDKAARGARGRANLVWIRGRSGYKGKLSVGVARRIARGEMLGFMRPEVQAKSLATRILNGTLVPNGAGRGICGFRQGLSHYCRSTLEANFARILLLEGIPYEHEPRMFVLPSGRHYTPDFRLTRPLGGLVPAGWVELKGWRKKDGTLPDGVEEKAQGFEAATGERVFVLTMRDPVWKVLEAEYAPRIPLWETQTRNLRTHPEVFGVRTSP